MAYLRLNRYQLELVQSRRVGGKPRALVLHRFRSPDELSSLLDPAIRAKLSKQLGKDFDPKGLIKKGRELFSKARQISGKAPQATARRRAREEVLDLPAAPQKPAADTLSVPIRTLPTELPELLRGKAPREWQAFVDWRKGFPTAGEYAQALVVRFEFHLLFRSALIPCLRDGLPMLKYQQEAARSGVVFPVGELAKILSLGAAITSVHYLAQGTADEFYRDAEVTVRTAWGDALQWSELEEAIVQGLPLGDLAKWIIATKAWLKGHAGVEEIRAKWDRTEKGQLRPDRFFTEIKGHGGPEFGRWSSLVWRKAVYSFGPIRAHASPGAKPGRAESEAPGRAKEAAQVTGLSPVKGSSRPSDAAQAGEGPLAVSTPDAGAGGSEGIKVLFPLLRAPFTEDEWREYGSDNFQSRTLDEQIFRICFPTPDARLRASRHFLDRSSVPTKGKPLKQLFSRWSYYLAVQFRQIHSGRQEPYAKQFLEKDPWQTRSSRTLRGTTYSRLYWYLFEVEKLPLPQWVPAAPPPIKETRVPPGPSRVPINTVNTTPLLVQQRVPTPTFQPPASQKSLGELFSDFFKDCENLRKPGRKEMANWKLEFLDNTKRIAGPGVPAPNVEGSGFLGWLLTKKKGVGAPRLEDLSDESVKAYQEILSVRYHLHEPEQEDVPRPGAGSFRRKAVENHVTTTLTVLRHFWQWGIAGGLIPAGSPVPLCLRPLPRSQWAEYIERKKMALGEPGYHNTMALPHPERLFHVAFPTLAERRLFLERFTAKYPDLARKQDPALCKAWLSLVMVSFREAFPSESEVARFIDVYRVMNPWRTHDSKANVVEYAAIYWYLRERDSYLTRIHVALKERPEVTTASGCCERCLGRMVFLQSWLEKAGVEQGARNRLGDVEKRVRELHLFLDGAWRSPGRGHAQLSNEEIRNTAARFCEEALIRLVDLQGDVAFRRLAEWPAHLDVVMSWVSATLAWLYMGFENLNGLSSKLEAMVTSSSSD